MNARTAAEIESLRLPPHSVEAEQAVLGGLLILNSAWDRIGDLIDARTFYRADHRQIYTAITTMIEENKPADVLTVHDELKRGGKSEDCGGMQYLHHIARGTPSASNIRRYAEIVRECAQRRALIEAGTRIADDAYASRGGKVGELCDRAQALIHDATSASAGKDVPKMAAVLGEVMGRLDELHRNPATVTGVATGFVDLDEQTAGLQRGDLIIVAGRPSMGKTGIAMNMAEHVALVLKLPVLVFTMEMSNTQLATRLLSALSKVDSHRLRTGKLDEQHWDRLGNALSQLNEAPIIMDETPALSAMDVRARARRHWRQYGGLGLIVVDYLQLMRTDGEENRATEVGDITRNLKTMAKELDCPVVALSQLNRTVEARANKRPMMADLRDSGSIEQDADVILFIYRDEVYNPDSPDRGIAEVIVGKQRNGPIGTVKLTFIAQHTRFENYAGLSDYAYQGPRAPRTKPRKALTETDD